MLYAGYMSQFTYFQFNNFTKYPLPALPWFLSSQIEMVSQGNDGVVLKVTCKRPTLTEPHKMYALKGLINYHNAKTMSRVSH